jgi:hypothetical protein
MAGESGERAALSSLYCITLKTISLHLGEKDLLHHIETRSLHHSEKDSLHHGDNDSLHHSKKLHDCKCTGLTRT